MLARPIRFAVVATTLILSPLVALEEEGATGAGTAQETVAAETASEEPTSDSEVEPAPKPLLVVPTPVHDLGKLQKGDRTEVEFVLENRGDAPLKIKSAQPACGCTVTSFDPQIAPGATGVVRAALDTSTLQGAVAKSITVLTNDAQTPRILLTIKAEVVTFVQVSPAFARVLQIRSLAAEPTVVHLWSGDGSPFEVTDVRTPERWIEARTRRAAADEIRAEGPPEQWRIEVSLTPEAPLGPLTDKLIVRTSHPRQPEVEIPLTGFVRAVLTTTPAVADFGKLGSNVRDKTRFVLKLFNFGTEPIELLDAATDLAFISVVTSPEDPGRRFRVELRVAPDAPKGKFEGTLRFQTTSSSMPVVEIPVRGRIG